MQDSLGTVKFNERTLTDRLSRDVDEKIRHWLRDHQLDGGPASYEVSFFDEDILEEVSCMLVVQVGHSQWRSWETASNARHAFTLSLERLQQSEQQGTDNVEERANGQRGSAGERPAVAEQTGPVH